MPAFPVASPRHIRWGRSGLPVPYAAAWSTETFTGAAALTVRADGGGLAYRDETPGDRDRHGVLWARLTEAPGVGTPDFGSLHSRRQRLAMFGMLCQVCGSPADRTARGWLFLLPSPRKADEVNWPEGALSTKPPLCEPCAALAMRHCPRLTEPFAVRVRKPRVWGVFGGLFFPAMNGGLAACPTDDHLPYGHPATPWFLASQLVVELTRCTPVELPHGRRSRQDSPGGRR
ncbi:hypothetical protein [Streptomyces marincola]|uniref:hypothetical protein n=1 Tax=Streptomyces marincola TaxID=2878388 RepID=UPI001CF4BB73|nr:hypothetical protein [Streptomyces marincola]UCM91190.1 hypothetical protein LC193_26410 [Streptomyces marincola]